MAMHQDVVLRAQAEIDLITGEPGGRLHASGSRWPSWPTSACGGWSGFRDDAADRVCRITEPGVHVQHAALLARVLTGDARSRRAFPLCVRSSGVLGRRRLGDLGLGRSVLLFDRYLLLCLAFVLTLSMVCLGFL